MKTDYTYTEDMENKNEMKVTNTIITKFAEATNANGKYSLEYNIADGILERVQINVYRKEQLEAIGSLYYDRGNVTLNFPYSSDMVQYIVDAAEYIGIILQNEASGSTSISTDS